MPRLYSMMLATILAASGAAYGAANPFGSFELASGSEAYENIASYKQPTAMLMTGECNRTNAHFAQARAAGAEVLAYMNFIEHNDGEGPCDTYRELYTLSNGQPAALWPFPTPGSRVNWVGATYTTHMLDIQAGSAWADRFVAAVEDLMRDDQVDGVFLDVVGARLWSELADWNNDRSPGTLDWTQAERDAWTQGCVDIVRRLDESRQRINPRFIIVNNSTWDYGGSGLPVGSLGEPYVDGIVLQNPTITPQHQGLAGRPYANRGHKRFIVTAPDLNEESQWVNVSGVTHTTSQSDWGSVDVPPAFPAHRLLDRPKTFGRTTIAAIPSAGMTADRKRASKFTLANDTGRLTELDAYLDGLGGASGSQQVQLVLYRDNNGVPGTKVATSAPRSLADGTAGTWRAFTVANLPLLTPGNYWIAIHTGGTAQVLRNFGDGAPNWYGNDDLFSDGASDPFGAGSTGTVELSVHAKYVVGQ